MRVSEKMEAIKSKREELFPWDVYAEQVPPPSSLLPPCCLLLAACCLLLAACCLLLAPRCLLFAACCRCFLVPFLVTFRWFLFPGVIARSGILLVTDRHLPLLIVGWDVYAEQCEKALSTPQGWVNPLRCPAYPASPCSLHPTLPPQP